MGTMRSTTWVFIAGVMLALALGAGAIAYAALRPDTSRGPVPITEAELVDARTLWIHSPSCHGDPEVTVEGDTDDAVSLKLVATTSKAGPACADVVEVSLEAPLGDRLVLDARGDLVVEVTGR